LPCLSVRPTRLPNLHLLFICICHIPVFSMVIHQAVTCKVYYKSFKCPNINHRHYKYWHLGSQVSWTAKVVMGINQYGCFPKLSRIWTDGERSMHLKSLLSFIKPIFSLFLLVILHLLDCLTLYLITFSLKLMVFSLFLTQYSEIIFS